MSGILLLFVLEVRAHGISGEGLGRERNFVIDTHFRLEWRFRLLEVCFSWSDGFGVLFGPAF